MMMLKDIKYGLSKDLCEVDINQLDGMLLKLPADMYIELYVKMQNHIEHKILNKFEESEKVDGK